MNINEYQVAFLKDNAEKGKVLGNTVGPNGEPMLSLELQSSGKVENIHVDKVVLLGEVSYSKN